MAIHASIPYEIHILIFSFLTYIDLKQCQQVCLSWRFISLDNKFKKRLFTNLSKFDSNKLPYAKVTWSHVNHLFNRELFWKMIKPTRYASVNVLHPSDTAIQNQADPKLPFWFVFKSPYLLTKAVENQYQLYAISEPDASSKSHISLVKSEELEQGATVADICSDNQILVILRNNTDIIVKSIKDDATLFVLEGRGRITSLSVKGNLIIAGKINGTVVLINWKSQNTTTLKGANSEKICSIKFISDNAAISVHSNWSYKIYHFTEDSVEESSFSTSKLEIPETASSKLAELGLLLDIEGEVTKQDESSAYPTPQVHPEGFEVWPQGNNCYFAAAWCESRVQYSTISLNSPADNKIASRSLTSTKSYIFKCAHPRRFILREKGILNTDAIIVNFSIEPYTETASNSSASDPSGNVSISSLQAATSSLGPHNDSNESEVQLALLDYNHLITLSNDGYIKYYGFN